MALALCTGGSLAAQAAPKGGAGANPDFTAGAPAPGKESHDWTLGPTGLRGWMFAEKMGTEAARQIYVTRVDKGAPADGVIAVGDVILGLDGKPFADDARVAFGKAVTAAEAGSGALRLLRWRGGKSETVTLKIAVLGSYGATAPYDCPKSARILEQGCKAIAARMRAVPSAQRGNPLVRSLNALALLASGKDEYLPLVREEARWAADFSIPEKQGFQSWWYGYAGWFLAEYELATQDPEVMPGLRRLAVAIAKGQSGVGTWGHAFSEPSGRLGGYGAMNQPGLSLTMSLLLARRAGVKDPAVDLAIERSDLFLRFYIGKGCIPYGDHHPWMETHDDNGKCGSGAVVFDLLENARGAAFFSRMSTASYGAERDQGHTGNFFNLLWAMPGVSRAGPQATGAWMREFSWYYDLARRWDGTFVYQGEPMAVEDNKYKDWDSTGAYMLAYAVPLRKTYFTGKKPCAAPPLSAAEARSVIEDGRGWTLAKKATVYDDRTVEQLFAGLGNWSPIVRERSAQALGRRDGSFVPRLLALLGGPDANAREGACQALAALRNRAADAVPALRKALWGDDLWLRIKAAEALANIGEAAKPAVPDLLRVECTPSADDPRGMVQRYVAFCLFYPGRVLNVQGLLARSLEGVDRQQLYPAVEAVLTNQDGRVREAISSVYGLLSYEEIRPLLPAVYRAILEPAPSGEMFADGIRLAGLELLAKYRIAEGVPLCTQLVDHKRWGEGRRIPALMKILLGYGAAAKSQLPELRKLEAALSEPRANGKDRLEDVRHAIATLEAAKGEVPLRSLKDCTKGGTK